MKRLLTILVTASIFAGGYLMLSGDETTGLTYEGIAQGFAGEVKAVVTMENGEMTQVLVTHENETQGYGTVAVDELPSIILDAGNTNVDTISGATVTSNAILEAVDIALSEAYLNRTVTETVQGFAGPVVVTIGFENGEIKIVEIIGESETPGYGTRAIDELPEKIIETQGFNVDVIAEATVTSEAILEALGKILND